MSFGATHWGEFPGHSYTFFRSHGERKGLVLDVLQGMTGQDDATLLFPEEHI